MAARKRQRTGGPADNLPRPIGPSTLAVHGGEPRPKPGHSLATPIMQTATFTFANTQELKDHFEGRIDRIEYGRYGNPTQRVAEDKLAALRKLVDRKVIRSNERVVVVSTANGLKFADQKASYHMGALEGIKPTHRNKPVELPADPKRVARAIARHVEKARLLVS